MKKSKEKKKGEETKMMKYLEKISQFRRVLKMDVKFRRNN